jgi:transcriptional regulator with XRE-family HTH domain
MASNLNAYMNGNAKTKPSGTLGQRITEAREAAGLTTTQLAGNLGIRPATMGNWEANKSQPRGNRLTTIAGFLNVSPTWLLTGYGEDPGTQTGDEIAMIRNNLIELRGQLANITERIEHLVDRLDDYKDG